MLAQLQKVLNPSPKKILTAQFSGSGDGAEETSDGSGEEGDDQGSTGTGTGAGTGAGTGSGTGGGSSEDDSKLGMYDENDDGVLSKAELGGYLVSVDEDASVNDLDVSLNNYTHTKIG